MPPSLYLSIITVPRTLFSFPMIAFRIRFNFNHVLESHSHLSVAHYLVQCQVSRRLVSVCLISVVVYLRNLSVHFTLLLFLLTSAMSVCSSFNCENFIDLILSIGLLHLQSISPTSHPLKRFLIKFPSLQRRRPEWKRIINSTLNPRNFCLGSITPPFPSRTRT